jgi:hypothetical protein
LKATQKTRDLDVFLGFLPAEWERKYPHACALERRGDPDSVDRSKVTENSTQWEELGKGDIVYNKKWYRMGEWKLKQSEKIQNTSRSGQRVYANGTEGSNQR